eukprot:365152-Chlamydomonas_euryale.AAC.10
MHACVRACVRACEPSCAHVHAVHLCSKLVCITSARVAGARVPTDVSTSLCSARDHPHITLFRT